MYLYTPEASANGNDMLEKLQTDINTLKKDDKDAQLFLRFWKDADFVCHDAETFASAEAFAPNTEEYEVMYR